MSNFSDSGCESGWTLYLQESFVSDEHLRRTVTDYRREEEGDLSMVSDASSGPPNGFDGGIGLPGSRHSLCSSSTDKSIQRKEKTILDDTASSHVFGFSKKENAEDFSKANSRKQHVKKPAAALFQYSSGKKPARKVAGEFEDGKW